MMLGSIQDKQPNIGQMSVIDELRKELDELKKTVETLKYGLIFFGFYYLYEKFSK